MISLAFWGGVWGCAYAVLDRRFPRGGGCWVAAFLINGAWGIGTDIFLRSFEALRRIRN
ncbi:MAG: hypothetical protein ACNA8S_11695 [Deferrisomatales bacterium]